MYRSSAMEETATDTEPQAMLQKYTSALSSFSASTSTFRILTSLPSTTFHSASQAVSTLYVLDSSFNPPTRAHLRIATSAILSSPSPPPKRLLLLLATQNADKEPKPASFPQRLVLMHLFAQDILSSLHASPPSQSQSPSTALPAAAFQPPSNLTIDICTTTHPYFANKAAAIASCASYPPGATQVHLTGFDTLIRILDPKYYPPTFDLAPLEPFLEKHRLRVAYRTGTEWGGKEEQDGYLKRLENGELEAVGGRRGWARRIEFVVEREEGEEVVSSTRVRELVMKGDSTALARLVTNRVREWILKERLYLKGF